MRRFKRKGSGHSKIEPLSHDHFSFRKSVFHGFPMSPSAITFDNETQLLAIGTDTGELRIYGQPGVEFSGRTKTEKSINQIFSFGSLHQYITVQDDNTLLLWQLEGEEGLPSLKIANEFQMEKDNGKTITSCALSKLAGHFYIGTEGGNIYTLDIKLFMLLGDEGIINWANATALIQGSVKVHPGPVVSIQVSPSNHNKLLLGYEKGIIVLWDVTQPLPQRNFPSSFDDIKQPLTSLAWQREGQKFISAHKDSSIYYWISTASLPEQGPTKHYGDSCGPIQRIEWLNTTSNPLDIFSGGAPLDDSDDHNIVTVIQGTEHVALDFSSKLIDFVTVIDPSTKRGKALIVLCQQELLVFDLEGPKCPQIKNPYLCSIHSSPITCLQVYDGVPKELIDSFLAAVETNSSSNNYFSNASWPVSGGYVRVSDPPTADLLVTGHSNGSIKFWDATSSAMNLIFELKTSTFFQTSDSDEFDEMAFSEFQWPPYRKVGSYDPFDDDTRLSIRFLEFCPYSCKLCVSGEGGQTLTFAFNPSSAEVRVEHIVADIFVEDTPRGGGRGRGLRNTSALECKTDFIQLPAGFQPSLCVQCMPATPITALAFRPAYGLVAAANSKGFIVANFYTKSIVLVHPTVLADGIEVRSIGRVQSMRRSLRSSLRRNSSTALIEERRKIVASFNLETGQEADKGFSNSKMKNKRSYSADNNLNLNPESPLLQTAVPPAQRGVVCHLLFAETHITGGGPHVSIIASTMGSSLIRYSIEVPKPELRYTSPNRAFLAGKDYSLVHAAPIIAVFVLDHEMQPLPSPSEVESRSVPTPNMDPPHYVLIVTQEQIKIVSLPNMRSRRKEKVNNLIHERISRAWMVKVKVPVAPVGASRDWNNALVIMTTIGHILVYSLPDIKLTYHKELYLLPSDQKAMQSLIISPNGESFHLRSFSELERQLLCSYNFSYHTSLLPSLHPFEGASSHTPQRSSSRRQPHSKIPSELASTVSASTNASSNNTPSHETNTTTTIPTSKPIANSQRFRSPTAHSEGSVTTGTSVRSRSMSPSAAMATNRQKEEEERINLSPAEKEVMASAAAFTQVYDSHRQSSSSSDSDDSESETSSDGEEDDMMGEGGGTFFNPALMMDDDTADGGGQELDTIIASSLQQLESARSFYEKMQKQARGSEH